MSSKSLPSLQNILFQIAEKQELQNAAILEKMDVICETLKRLDARRSSRRPATVNEHVGMLLAKYPDVKWTAKEFAKRIGEDCTPEAVRKSKQWKAYRKHIQTAKKNYRSKTAVLNDFDAVDARLDAET
jgi:hypothetical protein